MSARNMAKRTAAGTLALAVCLGGGAIALASAASADANFKFDTRIQGDDRYGTAVAASKAAFDKADNVILVNGYATVDGLTASYLAGVANAPILYVSDKGADDATKAEIKRLGAKNIWLVGGEKVIPASVADAIKGDGYSVTRINGSDRYETAALIAEAGIKISGKKPSTVFVASGTSFADALAVSPVAFVKGYPIILTDKDSTSDFSKKELGVIGTDSKVLVGGEAVVSKKVQADLSIKDEQRVAGSDRAVTANLVSDWAKKSQGFNPANAALVGGTNGNGADSLVAAPLLGKSFTTLHFAGWDATATYMKDHSAELTGKGFVFGGKAAVSDGQVSSAQSAAQSVAAAAAYTVTSTVATGTTTFKYADAKAAKEVTQKFTSKDKFFVDGVTATAGAFAGSVSVGDLVSVTAGADGTSVYMLTSKSPSDYKSGLVGDVTTATGSGNHKFDIIEPVSGVALRSGIDYVSNYTIYKVDNVTVSQAAFESEIQTGDSIAISGDDTISSPRVISLTNASVTGTIGSVPSGATSGTNAYFTVKSDAGAVLADTVADYAASPAKFVAVASDSITIDGKSGDITALYNAVSPGDKVTVARTAGKQVISVTNSAPASASGTAVSTTSSALTYLPSGKLSTTTFSLSQADEVFVVDGNVASKAELVAAVSPGDIVTVRDGDTASNTKPMVSVKNAALTGAVGAVTTTGGSEAFEVKNDDGVVLATPAYTNSTTKYLFDGNTAVTYSVDGADKTAAQFATAMARIADGSLKGTVEVSDSGTTTAYKLATTVFSAGPVMVSGTNPHSTTVTITLSKPVTAASAAANGDFTVTVNGTPATIATSGTVLTDSKTVTLTLSTATTAGDTVVVTPATQGLNKYTDVYGTQLPSSGLTITAS